MLQKSRRWTFEGPAAVHGKGRAHAASSRLTPQCLTAGEGLERRTHARCVSTECLCAALGADGWSEEVSGHDGDLPARCERAALPGRYGGSQWILRLREARPHPDGPRDHKTQTEKRRAPRLSCTYRRQTYAASTLRGPFSETHIEGTGLLSTNVPAQGWDSATTNRPTGRRVSRRRPVGLRVFALGALRGHVLREATGRWGSGTRRPLGLFVSPPTEVHVT